MSPRLRLPIGAISTVAFLGLGTSLLANGRMAPGAVLTGLGVYRGVMWILELRRSMASDEETP